VWRSEAYRGEIAMMTVDLFKRRIAEVLTVEKLGKWIEENKDRFIDLKCGSANHSLVAWYLQEVTGEEDAGVWGRFVQGVALNSEGEGEVVQVDVEMPLDIQDIVQRFDRFPDDYPTMEQVWAWWSRYYR
jgi:hypothetical protein